MDETAVCGQCGSYDVKRQNMMATFPAAAGPVLECNECGAVLVDKRDNYGAVIGETWKKPPPKEKPTQVEGLVTQCPDCAGYDIGRAPMNYYALTTPPSDMYECKGCGATTRRGEDAEGVITSTVVTRKTSGGALVDVTKPFEGDYRKDVEEMLVAVALLKEHPSAALYVEQLQKDLKAALGATNG